MNTKKIEKSADDHSLRDFHAQNTQQELCIKDLENYMHLFGFTGKGKVASIEWNLEERRTNLIINMRSCLEPGMRFAEFGGLTADEVADALNEELLSQPSQSLRP